MKRDLDKLRAWQQRGARNWRKKRGRTDAQKAAWNDRKLDHAASVDYVCEADGMHSPHCPGRVGPRGHLHHVHPRSQGGTDETSAVLWLWPDCHANIHNHPSDARERGYLTKGERDE